MQRRLLIGALAGNLAIASTGIRAQSAGRVYRIGYLSAPTRASVEQVVQSFERSLHDLGWVLGKNLLIEYRWAEGKVERLPEMAAELVRSKVDLIVAPAGSAALAAKNATSSIPIVMVFPIDPVGLGLVASLRRPGGNVTGTTATVGVDIFGKQLQLLKEVVPQATRMALLSNADRSYAGQFDEVNTAAKALGISLQVIDVRGPEEFEAAFAAMARERAQALFVGRSSTFNIHRAKLAELAINARLPTLCGYSESVEDGGLMAYAVNMTDFIGRAVSYVDKILKGAKPWDLAVEQPSKFDLSINLKTAKAIGVTIPQSLLVRADVVIR